jgi:hypothetical protein
MKPIHKNSKLTPEQKAHAFGKTLLINISNNQYKEIANAILYLLHKSKKPKEN